MFLASSLWFLTGSNTTLFSLVSAGLIFLFYLVFYIFLAGLFALTMYVMLQTLDDHKPTWQDRLSTPGAVTNDRSCEAAGHSLCRCLLNSLLSLLSLTGMVIRPKADEAFQIVYDIKKTETWDIYAQALDKFLARKSGCPGQWLRRIIRLSRMNCFCLIRDNSFTVSGQEIAFGGGFSPLISPK